MSLLLEGMILIELALMIFGFLARGMGTGAVVTAYWTLSAFVISRLGQVGGGELNGDTL